MTGRLMGGLVFIVVGLALTPIVFEFADGLSGTGGTLEGTTAGSLVSLIPILYVLIIVAGTIGYVVFSKRS